MGNEPVPAVGGDEPMRRAEYSISDLAFDYKVSLRTLRFYEDKGLLHPRREAYARFYNDGDRRRLELIIKGKRLGFTLAEISALISSRSEHIPGSEGGDSPADLTTSLDQSQISTQIAHLERQRSDLDEAIADLRRAQFRMGRS